MANVLVFGGPEMNPYTKILRDREVRHCHIDSFDHLGDALAVAGCDSLIIHSTHEDSEDGLKHAELCLSDVPQMRKAVVVLKGKDRSHSSYPVLLLRPEEYPPEKIIDKLVN